MRSRGRPTVRSHHTPKSAKSRVRIRNSGALDNDQDPLLAKLIELHGRTTEVARRVLDDARILADLQRDASALLGELWSRRAEPPRPAELPPDPARCHGQRAIHGHPDFCVLGRSLGAWG
jgi:hypothetical protein